MKKCPIDICCIKILLYSVTAYLLLFAGGCIPVAEREVVPFENLPPSYSFEGEQPAQASWWFDFNDPELNRLVQLSVSDNFNIQIARSRIDELRASARLAGASLIPSLDGRISATSTRNYSEKTNGSNFFFEFAASYEIDLWSRLRSIRDAALFDTQAGEADLQTVIITVVAELAQTWYQLTESRMQFELLNKQIEVNSKILELISTQFRAGKTGVADVLQQQQLVESNSETQASLRSEISQSEHQLAILMGEPPSPLAQFNTTSLPNLPVLPETGIPLGLLTSRPDIVAGYLRVQASDYRVAAAIADRFPQLSISASLDSSSERAADLFKNWFSSLGANLFGPLIDGGRRKAEVDRKKAIAAQSYLQYGQIILGAIGEVEDALIQEREQQRILKSRQIQLQLAASALEHVGNRYRQGVDDYQRVLIALLSHQNLQRDILISKRALINNRIALYRATSGRLSLPDKVPPPSPEQTLQ